MKKWIKISLLSVLGLIIVAGVLTWIEFGSIIQGAFSAEKLDNGLYYMEYKGDDGFKELMKRGGSKDRPRGVVSSRNYGVFEIMGFKKE